MPLFHLMPALSNTHSIVAVMDLTWPPRNFDITDWLQLHVSARSSCRIFEVRRYCRSAALAAATVGSGGIGFLGIYASIMSP